MGLRPEKADELSLKICDEFFLLPNISDYCVFHIYLPIERNIEINTFHIIKRLRECNKTIVVPRMKRGKPDMETCLILPESPLVPNSYGIPEPVDCRWFPVRDIEVVVMPLLAYDQKGYRLGYGKGYYDRFLSKFKRPVFKVGLSYFDPLPGNIERNPWDVPMNCCVTPGKTFWFSQP